MNQVSDIQKKFFGAIKTGDLQTVRQLGRQDSSLLTAIDYDEFGGTCLNLAAGHRGNLPMIELLMELGADVNQKSDWAPGPWSPALLAHQYRDNGIFDYLIQQGVEMDIHLAAATADLDQIKQLLDVNPELVHQRGGDGCLPLHFVSSTDAVDLLLERGADINARDIDHYSTAVQWIAARDPVISRHLIRRGAQVDIFTAVLCGDRTTVEAMLVEHPDWLHQRISPDQFPGGADGDAHNILSFTVGYEATLLHTAASGRQIDMIHFLLDQGLDVNVTGAYDASTALHTAAWNNTVDAADALIQRGADIEQRSGEIHNNTPMGWAIVAGSADMAERLVEQGCELHDYFLEDAKAGLAGEFRDYKYVDPKNFERIIAILK